MSDDDELRRGFSKLRDADARRAPPFTDLVRRGRPRAARSPWAITGALSSAAAAAVLLWCGVQSGSSDLPMAAAPASASPSATASAETLTIASSSDPEPLGFLLALPGSAALSTADLDTSLLQGESR